MSNSLRAGYEMEEALRKDGEKLRALTGEDHGPWPLDGFFTGARYEHLGNRSAIEGCGVGLSCHHCKVTWGGCAAECCCPKCGAQKGYHEDDRDVCYCAHCSYERQLPEMTLEQLSRLRYLVTWAIAAKIISAQG